MYQLERERTHLLSQNCQLKRKLDLSDANGINQAPEIQTVVKKRKLDNVMAMQTISDSSDEGLGSMSPEPVVFTLVTKHPSGTNHETQITLKDFMDLKHQLEVERRNRIRLEEQLRQHQMYQDPLSDCGIQYQEVIEHTDNIRDDISLMKESYGNVSLAEMREIHHHHPELKDVQVLSVETIPPIGQTQVVVCSPEMDEDDERTMTPDELPKEEEEPIIETKPIIARLQPILEAAIKAEPKVEVERIHSPASIAVITTTDANDDDPNVVTVPSGSAQSRMFLTSTSRQNLETIVEAIRHLEGDSFINDEITEQDAPLALTTTKPVQRQQLQVEMNSYLQFRTAPPPSGCGLNVGAVSAAPLTSSIVNNSSASPLSHSSSVVSHKIITSSNVIAAHHTTQQNNNLSIMHHQQQQQQQQYKWISLALCLPLTSIHCI